MGVVLKCVLVVVKKEFFGVIFFLGGLVIVFVFLGVKVDVLIFE